MRLAISLILLLSWSGCSRPDGAEILWDDWGVPHIYSDNDEDLFYAFGWAQAKSHGDLLLRLYGQARGRGAEYWGERYLAGDQWVRTMGVPARARDWYSDQDNTWQRNLDAFAEGINAYAQEHPDQITDQFKNVLPVDGIDVLAHSQRVILFYFVTSPQVLGRIDDEWNQNPTASPASNAWAIGPSRSSSGNTLLLGNPHLPWTDLYLFYEAHLVTAEMNTYGATFVGIPTLGIAFNDHLGWTHTVNAHDGDDLYELTLVDGGYRWDKEVKPFDTREEILKVRQRDGTLMDQKLLVRHSIHGPVVAEKNGKALALRVVGLQQSKMLAQYWDMGRATSLDEFEAALRGLEIPMFTVMYADQQGHIMHFFGGITPVRPPGVGDWSGIVPGDRSSTLWTKTHTYDELPKVIDPPSGWLQNANDPPWTTTFPVVLDPENFPSYMAPQRMRLRAQHSALMLMSDDSIDFEEMVEYKHSTHVELADRILDDLLSVAETSTHNRVQEAAQILASWDRRTDADSQGAILFEAFSRELLLSGSDQDIYLHHWDPESPLETPHGLADKARALEALLLAANKVIEAYGSLDVEWGKIHRLRGPDVDIAANGGPGALGVFRAVGFRQMPSGQREAVTGDSFVMAVEFSNPVRAQVLLSYGNSSQPDSTYRGNQLIHFAQKKLRPVWRSREEVEANLESREVF
ncbi:MAG: acylase [Acidobacteriota bacterium]